MSRPVLTTPVPALGDVLVVTVDKPVAGGQCLGRHEGRVVFVRDALPGESVRVSVTGHGRGGAFLRADTIEVLAASPDRVDPPCPIARECGGCDWQHASLPAQRALKAEVIVDALARTGGITAIAGVPLAEAVSVAPLDDHDGLHWRTRMRYAVGFDGTVGLRAARSHRIIPAADCPLAVPELAAAVPATVPPPPESADKPTLIAAASNTGEVVVAAGETAELLTEQVGARRFQVSADGFWQVHPKAPTTLVDTVLEFGAPAIGETVLDLFSGVGLFAGFLGEAVGVTGRVDAVEGDRTAIRLARGNTADLAWVHHHRSAVDRWVAANSRRAADLVVLDPPRAGAGTGVVTALASRTPRALVYVACDPVSLARDAKALAAAGYLLTRLKAFDLFPMTKHVECVALFEPAPAS